MSPITTPAALAAVGVVTLALRDPHRPHSYGACPSYALFGLYCPFCGGLRAVNDLTKLDVAAAVSSNAVLVLGAPLIVWWAALTGVRLWRGQPQPVVPRWATVTLVATLLWFTVMRNIGIGGALAP